MSGPSNAIGNTQTDTEQPLLVMCLLALTTGIIGEVGAWIFRQLIGMLYRRGKTVPETLKRTE